MLYCKETASDREELILFINKVFNEDFPVIMEKVYGKDQKKKVVHHLVKENGNIVAALGVLEQDFDCSGQNLKTGFIGSVSVAPEFRKQGFMKLLMQKAEEQMRFDGVVLAMLGGRRNRYGFFGYEMGGQNWIFNFQEENIRLTIGWNSLQDLEVLPVEQNDKARIDQIYSIYQKQKIRCRGREDFFVCCKTWGNKLYQIQENQETIGYLIANPEVTKILEIGLSKEYSAMLLLQVVRACMELNGKKNIAISGNSWQPELLFSLQRCCEYDRLISGLEYKILDYSEFFKAMLLINQTCHSLSDGSLTIAVKEEESLKELGRWKLTAEHGKVSVEPWEIAGETVDFSFTGQEVVRAFFSPASMIYKQFFKKLDIAGWFPFVFSPECADEF